MSALSRAQTRLEQAVTRLERVLAEQEGHPKNGAQAGLREDVRALREECEGLRGKLATTTKRQARMQAIVGEVTSRLDGAIDELDHLLER